MEEQKLKIQKEIEAGEIAFKHLEDTLNFIPQVYKDVKKTRITFFISLTINTILLLLAVFCLKQPGNTDLLHYVWCFTLGINSLFWVENLKMIIRTYKDANKIVEDKETTENLKTVLQKKILQKREELRELEQ